MAEERREGRESRSTEEASYEEPAEDRSRDRRDGRVRSFIPPNLAPPVDAAVVASLRDGSSKDGSGRRADSEPDEDRDRRH